MAGDWIKVRTDLPDDPAVILIADTLGMDQDLVVGKLTRLWSWTDRHTVDGEARLPASWIDRFLGVVGFADAMAKAGWLTILDGAFAIPKFDRHNGAGAKKRAMAAQRQSKKRIRDAENDDVTHLSRSLRDENVTREEKRREEKRIRTPPSPPGGVVQEEDLELPRELDSLSFRAAWKRWEGYRRDRGLPKLRAVSVRQKLRELAGWGEPLAIQAIDQSIGNSWQGLFRPKHETLPGEPHERRYWEKSVTERLLDDFRREADRCGRQ